MEKRISHIFYAILILIIGFSGGFFIGKKISNINKTKQSIEVLNVKKDKDIEIINIKSSDETNTDNAEAITIKDKELQPEKILTKEEIKEKNELNSNACPKPKKEYDDMSSLAIGQDKSLPDVTYIPKDLREINSVSSTKGGICLIKEARNNFEALTKKALEDGYRIKASSGFRNYETQKTIMANEINSGNPNASIAVAKAGYSEHQLGTAIDVTGLSIRYDSASKKFDKSDEANWMEKYASEYGFIESYPSGKEKITGYMYEPWHYRYVGLDKAKEIIKNNQTINEYLNQ